MAYSVYYFTACKAFWGRAIGVILTLEEAKAEYSIHLPEEAPSERFTYPVITLDSGETIGQVPAILNILGEHFGLNGQTKKQQIMSQQAVLDMNDIFSLAQSGHFTENPERATQWFKLLESKLVENKFLVADTPTVADFHGVFATEWVHKCYDFNAYETFPRLAQWWQDICNHPPVAKMKNGDIPMIP